MTPDKAHAADMTPDKARAADMTPDKAPPADITPDRSGGARGVLETLVSGLFDYAGMFPPASLDFESALRIAAGFPTTLERPWLVGSEAVLSSDRLPALTAGLLADCGFQPGQELRVAVLGPPVPAADLNLAPGLARWTSPVGPTVRLVSYEIKVARLAAETAPALEALMHACGAAGMRLYVEPEWAPAVWLAGAADAAALLARLHASAKGPGIGLKVRGSGPTAIDRPALAAVVAAVNASGLPFKATAGLHHPVVEPERYGNALGFVNLAAALRLNKALGPDRFGVAEVEACLGETDPAAFDFAGRLAWRDFAIGAEQLTDAIRAVPFSIGSCSLHEPDQDLVRLFSGWAPAR